MLGRVQSPVLRVAPAERSPSQWEAARHLSTTPSPTTPFPCPPRTSREASSLSSSLGKSREGREGAQAICGTQKVAQQQQEQQDGEEQWSGKLVKRFFSPAYSFYLAPSPCNWMGKKVDRQSEKFFSSSLLSLSHLVPISAPYHSQLKRTPIPHIRGNVCEDDEA